MEKEKPIVASLPPTAAEIDLGIDVSPITEELAEQFSLDQSTGILVVRVVQGGVANAEGLRKGDVIQEVNRTQVPTMREFRKLLEAVQPGETILLRILRESKAFFVVLKP